MSQEFLNWTTANHGNWLATFRPGDAPLWVYELLIELTERVGDIGAEGERLDADADPEPIERARIDEVYHCIDMVNEWVKRAYPAKDRPPTSA